MENIKRMQRDDVTICAYCGKEKQGCGFVIGASTEADWCMIEGTGKMACPDCYGKAQNEAEKIKKQL